MELTEEELKRIDEKARRKIFEYLDSQKRKPDTIDRTTWYRIKKGVRGIGDDTLRKMIEVLTPEEFAKLIYDAEVNTNVRIDTVQGAIFFVEDAVKKFKEIVDLHPELTNYVADKILPFVSSLPHSVTIKPEHIKKFEAIMKMKGLAKKTYENNYNYLLRALRDLNYQLSPDALAEYIVSLQEESPNVAEHVAKALKLFIKEVLKDKLLYDSFKTPRASSVRVIPAEFLDYDNLKKIFEAINHVPAKAFFLLLAESGWRPNEIFSLTLDKVDFKERLIRLEKVTRSKRAYITFLHEKTAEWLEKEYLPVRQSFVEAMKPQLTKLAEANPEQGIDVSEWEKKLFPYGIDSLREKIREGVAKVLGEEKAKTFTLYYLRHAWSTYMRRNNAPADITNLLQGRAPPKEFKILVEGYTHYGIEDLRKVYEKFAPCLICNR
ncbi:site-specific integrase [Sulfurisphaera javensis]|uniref:Site-specific integrase n=1 Tax=Sulfurisphaera javensis TaxID=2049879 RepID=A0AAT9GRB6_9CREN